MTTVLSGDAMVSIEEFSSLVEDIHSVPFVEDGWTPVLGRVVNLLESRWAQVHISDFNGPGTPLSILHPFDSTALVQYVNHYINIDPRAEVLSKRDNVPRPRDEIVSRESFIRSEIFNDFLCHYEAEQSLIVPIQGVAKGVNFIAVMRSEEQGPYGEHHVRRFLPLIRHFQHLLMVWKRLVDAESRSLSSAAALNMIDMGIVFLNDTGRVVFMNSKAQWIANEKDGFMVDKNGKCRAADPIDDAKLGLHVGAATEAGVNGRLSPCDAIRLTRPSGKRSVNALVVALMPQHFEQVSSRVGAVLFLNDTTAEVAAVEDLLLKLYGLTPAEARLAKALLNGLSIAEHCESVGVSENTARTQLKHVLQKCEARGQPDLLRALLRGPELMCAAADPEV